MFKSFIFSSGLGMGRVEVCVSYLRLSTQELIKTQHNTL